MDTWLTMAISVVLLALKETIKNPAKKAELKKAMLKIRDQINLIYGDDPDFLPAESL
jgi:hypothetical protein